MQRNRSDHCFGSYTRFNPHPARRPGATIVVGCLPYAATVSILTRPEGRVQPGRRSDVDVHDRVSILTRPEGRVQPSTIEIAVREDLFQSSPGQKAGCNHRGKLLSLNSNSLFQSSPGQKAGCNRLHYGIAFNLGVVSILTRPEGRVQRLRDIGKYAFRRGSFNPHPARRPGATAHKHWPVACHDRVSILTRPEGRVQRLYLNFLSVLREPPDTALPICFHRPGHPFSPATIQLRTRTSRLEWLQHWVRVRPPGVL